MALNSAATDPPQRERAGQRSVIFDCRFALGDPEAGRAQYLRGHVPGAHYLDLEQHLCGPVGPHGGRHPLPEPTQLQATLARFGVGPETPVIAYDDSRLAFAARLWWLMRSLGYRPPRLLNGGFSAYLAAGGLADIDDPVPTPVPVSAPAVTSGPADADGRASATYAGCCDRQSLAALFAAGGVLVDSREAHRYEGLQEPIDPVAGHIPGAVNRPWQGVTDTSGRVLDSAVLRTHWGDLLQADTMVVYCGSGVTACVNLFSLALLGRDDAQLYPGSWSDWCSWLPADR
ncbi:MAG: sulfurtransferase [Halioglobus sp.]|nr:sulfurtransferase [Halioglobus sp.]